MIAAISSTLMLSGCDYFKKKKDEGNAELAEWSCTNQDNINQIQKYLKDEYLREVGMAEGGSIRFRTTGYQCNVHVQRLARPSFHFFI